MWMTWSPYDWMTLAVAACAQSWLTIIGNFSGSGRYFNKPSKQRLTEGRLQENTIMGSFSIDLSLSSILVPESEFVRNIPELIFSKILWSSAADFCEIAGREYWKKKNVFHDNKHHTFKITFRVFLHFFEFFLHILVKVFLNWNPIFQFFNKIRESFIFVLSETKTKLEKTTINSREVMSHLRQMVFLVSSC